MDSHILSQSEIEVFVGNLCPSRIEELGEIGWFESHKRLHMLYQEVLLETVNGFDDMVKETFLLHGKVKVLVYETISLSVWRHNVFPQLSKMCVNKETVFPIFVMLYHEATAFGLLESLSFHPDCVESLQDKAVELLDYCVQSILQMVNRKVPQVLHEKLSDLSPEDELAHYESNIVHNLALRSVCVLRYIAEAFELLPLSITSRFYNSHDIPMLLCQVLELAPWFSSNVTGKNYHFVDGNWIQRGSGDEAEALNKSEGQAWLCLRQVLLDQRFLQNYELNDYRIRQLSKLIRHLHDEMLDQLSPLADLKHFLCQLSMSSVSNPQTRPLIIELIAEYRDKLLRRFANKWEKLVIKQVDIISNLDISEIQNIAKGLSEAYQTLDLVEPEPPKCSNCGDPAAKRCSRCKNEWYCGRECQVKRWSKHKPVCSIVAESK